MFIYLFIYFCSGHFVFHDETTKFSISAHLSSKASQRVYNEVQKLPSKICFKKKLKFSTWPKSFLRSPPTDDNIGLFFFPSSVRYDLYINLSFGIRVI